MSFSCQYSMHVRRCNFALLVWRLQCIIYQLTTNHWAYAMFEYLCMRVYQMRGKWGEVDRHISWNSSNLGHLRLHSVLSVMMIIQIFALKHNNNNNNNRHTQISSPVCQQTLNSVFICVLIKILHYQKPVCASRTYAIGSYHARTPYYNQNWINILRNESKWVSSNE